MASVETSCEEVGDGRVSLGKRRSRRAPSGAKRMKTRSQTKSPIEKLPPELLVAIFEKMGNATMNICAMVCKRWRAIFTHYTADPPLWFGDITSIDGWIWGYIREDNPLAFRTFLRARRKCSILPHDIIEMAICNDNVRFLREYLRHTVFFVYADLDHFMINQAAFQDSLECLKYLREKGYYVWEDSMYYAAMNGSLRSLKWLYDEIHHKIDTKTLHIAMERGNTQCLMWMLKIMGLNVWNQATSEFWPEFSSVSTNYFHCPAYTYKCSGYVWKGVTSE